MHIACQNGHVELFDWLVSLPNIDLNAQTSTGVTPLHAACTGPIIDGYLDPFNPPCPKKVEMRKRKTEIVEQLVANVKNWNINFNHDSGRNYLSTALQLASRNGMVEIVELLVKNADDINLDINLDSDNMKKAVQSAKEHEDKRIKRILLGRDRSILWKLWDMDTIWVPLKNQFIVLYCFFMYLGLLNVLMQVFFDCVYAPLRTYFADCDARDHPFDLFCQYEYFRTYAYPTYSDPDGSNVHVNPPFVITALLPSLIVLPDLVRSVPPSYSILPLILWMYFVSLLMNRILEKF